MGVGRTLGGIAGGIGGFAVGGPGGAMLGYAGGSALGGAIEDQQNEYDSSGSGGGVGGRNWVQYGGQGAGAEAERASRLGTEGAAGTRTLGRQLGYDTEHGMTVAGNYQRMQQERSNGLSADAAGMYGRAEGNAADAAAARGDSMAAIGRLRNFYEGGPGPSAAQAQLRAGQDSANRNALAMAHTGAGGANSMRAAMRAGATGNQQANQAAAGLRAQEAAQWQQTRLGAMGQEQNALSNVRAGDVGTMGQRYGAAGQQMGAAGAAAQTGLGYGQLGGQYTQLNNNVRMGAEGMAIGQQQAGEQMRNGILSTQLNADASRYGADKGVAVGMANVAQRDRAADMAMTGSLIGAGVDMYGRSQTSDIRAKENIQPASAAALLASLDRTAGNEAADVGPRYDLRPAKGYSYDYTDPKYGRDNQVGPMAQDLEHTAAAGAVSTGPDGMKRVDPNRLTMTNTAAIGEQQRRLDRLEAMAADKEGIDFNPQNAATNGQGVIRKVEAIEGRRMGADEKRAMATFAHSGSIKPEDEEYIQQTTPRRVARRR